MKTGKLIKDNCSKKNFRDCWHRKKLFFYQFFYLLLLFTVLTRGRCVLYGNVVVQ